MLENIVLNATAAHKPGVPALAIAHAVSARIEDVVATAQDLVRQQVLLVQDADGVAVYRSIASAPPATGQCWACSSAAPRAPMVVCDACQKRIPRNLAEGDLVAALVAESPRALNVADLAARSRAGAAEVERTLLAWTKLQCVALDASATEPAWSCPGIERWREAGEASRAWSGERWLGPALRGLPRKRIFAALLALLVVVGVVTHLNLRSARKATSNSYWNIKSALADHEKLIAPLAAQIPGMNGRQMQHAIGLSVGVDLADHLRRAKLLNDIVIAASRKDPPVVTLETFTAERVLGFDARTAASLVTYNAQARKYASLRASLRGTLMCTVSRCTPFDPVASPF